MLAAITTALISPASAASLYNQYLSAKQMVLSGTELGDDFDENYSAKLAGGIGGVWIPIGYGGEEGYNRDVVSKMCDKAPTTISADDRFTLRFVAGKGTDREYTTIYTSEGGSKYAQYTNAAQLLHAMRMDDPKIQGDPKLHLLNEVTLLKANNGLVTILWPLPDILFVQTNDGSPRMLGRCSSE